MHQINPKADSFRVKIWRSLQKVGAIQIKSSVYVLPDVDDNLKKLELIVNEISTKNGEAFLCKSQFVSGIEQEDLIAKFNEERISRFDEVASNLKDIRADLNVKKISENKLMNLEHKLGKIKTQIEEVKKLDYFECGSAQQVETLYNRIYSDLIKLKTGDWPGLIEIKSPKNYINKTWVTRADIHIDRMASAWLILKFIDPKARFKFTDSGQYKTKPNEVCFDMFNAEFGHVGEKCTFEVLTEAFSISDKRINGLKKIIHDLDIKDQKYDLPETPGVKMIAESIIKSEKADLDRIGKAKSLFDGIFQNLKEEK